MSLSTQKLRERLERHLTVVAMVALAGFQLVTATHAFAHDGIQPADVCGVCVQLEQHDDHVTVERAGFPPGFLSQIVSQDEASAIFVARVRLQPARAPPVI